MQSSDSDAVSEIQVPLAWYVPAAGRRRRSRLTDFGVADPLRLAPLAAPSPLRVKFRSVQPPVRRSRSRRLVAG